MRMHPKVGASRRPLSEKKTNGRKERRRAFVVGLSVTIVLLIVSRWRRRPVAADVYLPRSSTSRTPSFRMAPAQTCCFLCGAGSLAIATTVALALPDFCETDHHHPRLQRS